MKKISLRFVAFSICFVFLTIQSPTSFVFAQSQNKIVFNQVQQLQQDFAMANLIKQSTNRSADDLIPQVDANGEISLNLQGRYQNLTLAKLKADGEPFVGCVATLPEANAFFGKNLETGQIIPTKLFPFDKTSTDAKNHGMSKQEYLFYKDLIEKAMQERLLNPNAATLTIVNNDGAGEGFNDISAVTPEGGNNGTTLGQQRLNLFNFAAGIWGAFLDSSVTIQVRSQFDPQTCTSTSAVLGSAGTTTIHANFPNAGMTGIWHHQALANKQAGNDVNAGQPDINATFNSNINGSPGCLGGARFYLGFDNSSPPGTINLLITLLHEMGHGLGFSNFVNETNGTFPQGLPDVYTTNTFDQSTNKYWNDMTNAERITSAVNTNNVFWDGANVKIASGFLTNGRDTASGRVGLFTPNPLQLGSSVSHFSNTVFPNVLMEPNISLGLPLDLDLTKQQMRDVGWYRDTTSDLVPDTITGVTPSGGSVVIGTVATINWINNGGFNKNVTVELSTDGGTTYPTQLAINITNTGSTTFTVPNTPTNLAKVRVREENFTEPIGESANNFTIGTVIPPTNTSKFDFDGDGKSDISIFRPGPNPAQWWILRSSDFGNDAYSFGIGSDTPVPADFTGDGKTDVAFWRESTGEWFVLRSEDNSFFSFPFGTAGDIPVPGDFDGDGMADPAVFRPSTATWFILNSGGGTTITTFGISEDKPVVGDYDGDGKADIAIYRPSVSQWWLNRSTDGVVVYQFGTTGDKTVQGDYTGDGKDDVAFWRPSNGFWFVIRSEDNSFYSYPFGAATDIPIPGDYDGDGKQDAAVFRPSTTTWFLQGETSGTQIVTFGFNTDVPLANSFVYE